MKQEAEEALNSVSEGSDDSMECPLCLGEGKLKRTEVLERLGVKDLARVAQLSAEEAFRLLQSKYTQQHDQAWARFDAELAKRVAEVRSRHADEIHTLRAQISDLQSSVQLSEQLARFDGQRAQAELEATLQAERQQNKDLLRRLEDYLTEITELRQRNQGLEAELSKVSRIGKKEEMDFAEEASTWPGISVSEKLPSNGDYILSFRDPSGAELEPRILVDNKNKAAIAETDITKLIRDARSRSIQIAVLVTRECDQLRRCDKEARWSCTDGVWLLRTTRQWLPRDLDVLKPLFERMREEGPDFLQKNAAVADEVRRSLADLDLIEKELGKATKAVHSVSELLAKHRTKLTSLCR